MGACGGGGKYNDAQLLRPSSRTNNKERNSNNIKGRAKRGNEINACYGNFAHKPSVGPEMRPFVPGKQGRLILGLSPSICPA
ncbi:hypothetical protein GCM10023185_30800 [Hymenobacter saemangeumensis]|uniref:Uncharacterized protein n=1 Tax=Hymenobacter saemangeumensis TaxID=1084522 RepID=A0ABP8ILS5_9BACT